MTRRDSIKSMFGAFFSWGALPDAVSVAELIESYTGSTGDDWYYPFRKIQWPTKPAPQVRGFGARMSTKIINGQPFTIRCAE